MIRLQKYLAECGIASRRKAEELIRTGRVEVNSLPVTSLGVRVEPGKDGISLDGKLLGQRKEKIYIKLNKPRGYVSSTVSQRGEKTIFDLLKGVKERLYPVGRLDKDSEGLMLLTNDGELANKLMHPRYEHEKEYLVNVKCPMTNDKLRSLESGILIDGEHTLPAKVKRLGEKSFSIVLREGKKRQIRRMVGAVGNQVVRLVRTRIGDLHLGNLPSGKFEYVNMEPQL